MTPKTILKISIAAVLGPGYVIFVENNPTAIRDNICAWEFFDDCRAVLESDFVVLAVQRSFGAFFVCFLLWVFWSIAAEDFKKSGLVIHSAASPNKSGGLPPMPLPAVLLPNWSMKDLLHHVLENIEESDEVIREVEAKARLDVLKIWGRLYSPFAVDQNDNPPRKIPPDHWDDFTLDYLTCAQHPDPAECCTEPRGGTRGSIHESYQDLKVNRQQVLGIWPERPEISGTIPAYDVLLHIVRQTRNRPETAEVDLRDNARAGKVLAHGRKNSTYFLPLDTPTLEPIPKEDWGHMKIDIAATHPPLPSSDTIYIEGHSSGHLYSAIRFNKKEVLSLWPEENT